LSGGACGTSREGVTVLSGDTLATPTGFDRARSVADAVLYEGYLLYPYRKSSGKNAVRWQFGVLPPRRWAEPRGPVTDGVAGSTEWWWQQTECLAEAPESAAIHLRPRFLQVQAKTVEQREADGRFTPVERLALGERAEVAFDEAAPREADAVVTLGELLGGERRIGFGASGDEETESAHDEAGREVGRVIRRRWPVAATMVLSAVRAQTPFPAYRLRVRIENADDTTPPELYRPEALRTSLVAAHCVLGLNTGSFLSLLEPPEWAAAAAKACRNVRTFPVLAGAENESDLLLSSPIILYDHPETAPERPGDLHESGEIDELLSLRALTLSEEEKAEARATDPRAAAIVDRIDDMPPEVMERLHGAIRGLRPAGDAAAAPDDSGAVAAAPAFDAGPAAAGTPAERPSTPWWDPGADASVDPETDHVVVDGVRVTKGSRVRLRPRPRGTDAHDLFVVGRTATVAAVLLDVDDSQHVAVTIDDDPRAELVDAYRRFQYFRPEEVEPIPAGEPVTSP
jgi:hypothetical protein